MEGGGGVVKTAHGLLTDYMYQAIDNVNFHERIDAFRHLVILLNFYAK